VRQQLQWQHSMKIQLDYKIDIDVREGNKSKEKLSIFFREPTRDEKLKQKTLEKKFVDIYKKAQKNINKQHSLEKKAELYELNSDYDKSLRAIEEKETLEEKAESLFEELEEIGGEDQDAFAEEIAKQRYEMLVSGKDKEKLEVYAEVKGYVALMRDLDVAKAELEKKQSGE